MLDAFTLRRIRAGELACVHWVNDANEDVLMVFPTSWSSLDRANAICVLQHFGHQPLTRLAEVALLVTDGDAQLAWKLLIAGWCPHEPFMRPSGTRIQLS